MKKIILLLITIISVQFSDAQVMNRLLSGQNVIQLINADNYMYVIPAPDNRVFPASFDVLRLKTYNITGFNDSVLSRGNLHFQAKGNYFGTPTGTTSQYLRGDGTLATFPAIPASPVNPDWNAPSGLAMILNKPMNVSAFSNDANYITQTAGDTRYALMSDTFPAGNIMTTRGANSAISTLNTTVNGKQNTLVSGTNIKTLETQSLLGSGNIDLSKSDVGLSNVDNTSDASKPVSTAQATAIGLKQDQLISGTNIKTVGGVSLLGSGNISVGSGTVTSVTVGTGLSGGTITGTGTISMPNVGTAGTYGRVTTDAQGRVTAGKRQETYSGTTDASGNYTVTFATAYSVAPNIQAQLIGGTDLTFFRVVSVTTTGFTVYAFSRSSITTLPIIGTLTGALLGSAGTALLGGNIDVLITEK